MTRWIALSRGAFAAACLAASGAAAKEPVNAHNFARAETDLYFGRFAEQGGLGAFIHTREPAPIDKQDVVRLNRDTLYSFGLFDLDAGPVTVTLPDPAGRFMSMMAVSQDHYAYRVEYGPGRFTFDRAEAGTRYVVLALRTFADPGDPADVAAANRLQDAVAVEQAGAGSFEAPDWDETSRAKARDALAVLGGLGGFGQGFGRKDEVDPLDHLVATSIGWGGNPPEAATYVAGFPEKNDGTTRYELKVRDVPVDGFWSVTVYNAKGYIEKNDLDAYSFNDVTAKPDEDGGFTIRFGGCESGSGNCLPVTAGWNYTVRLYRPRKEILDGTWTFPEATPVE